MRYDSDEPIIVTPFDAESYRNNGKQFSNDTGLNQEQFDPRFYTHDNRHVYCHSCRDLVKFTDSIETYITVPKKRDRKGNVTYEYQEVSYCHSCYTELEQKEAQEEASNKKSFIKAVLWMAAFIFLMLFLMHQDDARETARLKAIAQKYKMEQTPHRK